MGESSLDKVSKLIIESEPGKTFRARVGDILKAGFEISYTYAVDYKGKESCTARPKSRLNDKLTFNMMNDAFEYGNYPFSLLMTSTFTDEDVENLVDATFGVKKFGSKKKMIVPTYNLKKEKVIESVKVKLSGFLYDQHLTEKLKIDKDLDTRIRAHFDTEECKAGKVEARTLHIIEKLKEVMIKFKDVTPQIIERASNEAICYLVTQD